MSHLPRFYVESSLSVGDRFFLRGAEAHHLACVLRAGVGRHVLLFTREGREFEARVKRILAEELELEVLGERVSAKRAWRLALAQAIPKSGKMDWIVEKATELGVDEIFPLLTRRVVKTPRGIDRWQRIALAAAKQSGRAGLPTVHLVEDWRAFLERAQKFDLAVIASLGGKDRKRMDEVVQSSGDVGCAVLAIGPEGDFTSEEVEEAVRHGFCVADLGPQVLRSETAAIAGLALLQHELTKSVKRET